MPGLVFASRQWGSQIINVGELELVLDQSLLLAGRYPEWRRGINREKSKISVSLLTTCLSLTESIGSSLFNATLTTLCSQSCLWLQKRSTTKTKWLYLITVSWLLNYSLSCVSWYASSHTLIHTWTQRKAGSGEYLGQGKDSARLSGPFSILAGSKAGCMAALSPKTS